MEVLHTFPHIPVTSNGLTITRLSRNLFPSNFALTYVRRDSFEMLDAFSLEREPGDLYDS